MSKILTKDDVISNIEYNNLYYKYYLDIKRKLILGSSTIAYAKLDSNNVPILSFGPVLFKDLEINEVTLKNVPCVKTIDGTIVYNNGYNFIIAG